MSENKKHEVQKTGGEPESRPSRRGLFSSIGAGAVAAALVNPGKIFAATTPPIPSIRIPKEITDTLAEATHLGDFSEKGGIRNGQPKSRFQTNRNARNRVGATWASSWVKTEAR